MSTTRKDHPRIVHDDAVTRPDSAPRRTVKWTLAIVVAFVVVILFIVALAFFLPPDYRNAVG